MMILLYKYLKILNCKFVQTFFFANSFLPYKRCKYLQMKLQIQLLHNIQQMLIVILVEKMQVMGLCPLPYLEVVVHLWLLVHSIVHSSSLCLCLHPILIQFELPPYFSICSRDSRAYMYLLYGWQLLGMVPIRVDSTLAWPIFKHNQTLLGIPTLSLQSAKKYLNCGWDLWQLCRVIS